MVVIGDASAEQEHLITILRGAQLILEYTKADGSKTKLGRTAIVEAIERLNDTCEERILSCMPTIKKQTATVEEIKSRQVFTNCEDTGLSLGNPGIVYKALDVPEDTPVLCDQDRQQLLDVLCCFYDLSNNQPANKGVLWKVWGQAVSRQDGLRKFYWP